MDPVARRFMWDVISAIVTKEKKCSLILTTHSMEGSFALHPSSLSLFSLSPFPCVSISNPTP
jgi:hypothetical protein